MIFEYVEKDLRRYLEDLGEERLDPAMVKKLLNQLLSGMADCHMKRVIHRDLKPANIFIDKNSRVYLIQIR